MTTSLKTCLKCGDDKPLDEFYRHKKMADGHLNKCKACTKNDVHSHRRNPKYRDRVLEYDRARGNRQTDEHKRRRREMQPKQTKARAAVNNAVRDGRLHKPDRCSHCNAFGVTIVGHHYDYDKPLDVVWLCHACHNQLHALLATVERESRGCTG